MKKKTISKIKVQIKLPGIAKNVIIKMLENIIRIIVTAAIIIKDRGSNKKNVISVLSIIQFQIIIAIIAIIKSNQNLMIARLCFTKRKNLIWLTT